MQIIYLGGEYAELKTINNTGYGSHGFHQSVMPGTI